jgi:hypothetical protein
VNDALFRVTAMRVDVSTRRRSRRTSCFEYQDASGLQARKEFRFDPANYVVTFSASAKNGAQTFNPTIVWGPGLGDIGAVAAGGSIFTGNAIQPPEAIFQRGAKEETRRARQPRSTAQSGGAVSICRNRRSLLHRDGVNPGQARLEYRAADLQASGAQRPFVWFGIRVAGQPRNVRFYVGPKQFDMPAVGRCAVGARHQLRDLLLARHPAAQRAEMAACVHRKLRCSFIALTVVINS